MEQIGVALPYTAWYSTLGIGTTGLTVTVDVYRNGTEIVTAGACTDAGDGLYTYELAAASNNAEGVYAAVFKTATATVDQQQMVAGWYVGKAGVENLDAPISTVDTVVDAVKAKTDNLPTDPADQSAVEAAITAATSPLATSINLAAVDTVVDAIKAKTDNLPTDPADQSAVETAINTRMATFVYTAPDNAGIAAIKAKTDNLPVDPSDESNVLSAIAAIPAAVLGGGAIAYTPERITNPSHIPLAGVRVWVTSDSGGMAVVASGYTNTFGYLTDPFQLDAGTYYLWKQAGGYSFTNPETIVVT